MNTTSLRTTGLALLLAGGILAGALPLAAPLAAQAVSEQAALQLLRDNPEAVRERIRQSGMSQSEIRGRLTSAGLPAGMLDSFMGGAPLDVDGQDGAETIRALQLLGVTQLTADGLSVVPVEAGMQARVADPNVGRGPDIFGLDAFTRTTSQFQPLLSGPVPDDYRIGPGDEMVLVLTGDVELAHELIVTREGFIVIPSVGQIPVSNVTMAGLRNILRSRLARSYSGIEQGTTTFDITISRLRTNQIYLVGEVAQAGAYQLASVATVMNALYAAGGPTRLGNLRDIQVRRGGAQVAALDLYDYLLDGNTAADIILEQGDVIFVPLHGRRVQLSGAVVRPAIYELSGAEDLVEVLRAAGGFAPSARKDRLTIRRVLDPSERGPGLVNRTAIDLTLRTATEDDPTSLGGVSVPPIGLRDGDIVEVDAVPELESEYYVTIEGRVESGGRFPWRHGMTLRELVELARGPTVGADLREAEVARLPITREDGALAEVLRAPMDSSYLTQRDSGGAFAGPPGVAFPPAGAAPEFYLEPYDRVTVLLQPEFEMQRTVTITGEVPVPGPYTLRSKEDRVADLVGRAGGPLPTAYVEGARLIRRAAGLGRIDIELDRALSNPGGVNNIVLEPGDSLHIPIYSPTVEVRGAVVSPSTILYREGEGLDYYIENAGGFRSDADEDRVSVRYANGQARVKKGLLIFWSRSPEPGPGSVITVGARDPADDFDTRGFISDLVTIVGSVATVIIVALR